MISSESGEVTIDWVICNVPVPSERAVSGMVARASLPVRIVVVLILNLAKRHVLFAQELKNGMANFAESAASWMPG